MFAYADSVDVVAYLGTVVAICGLAIGAMYVIVGLLGKRIDDLRVDIDARFTENAARMAHLETQNDSLIDAVAALGQRVAKA